MTVPSEKDIAEPLPRDAVSSNPTCRNLSSISSTFLGARQVVAQLSGAGDGTRTRDNLLIRQENVAKLLNKLTVSQLTELSKMNALMKDYCPSSSNICCATTMSSGSFDNSIHFSKSLTALATAPLSAWVIPLL